MTPPPTLDALPARFWSEKLADPGQPTAGLRPDRGQRKRYPSTMTPPPRGYGAHAEGAPRAPERLALPQPLEERATPGPDDPEDALAAVTAVPRGATFSEADPGRAPGKLGWRRALLLAAVALIALALVVALMIAATLLLLLSLR